MICPKCHRETSASKTLTPCRCREVAPDDSMDLMNPANPLSPLNPINLHPFTTPTFDPPSTCDPTPDFGSAPDCGGSSFDFGGGNW